MELMIAKLAPFILIVWTYSGHQDFHVLPFQTMEACEATRTKLHENDWYSRSYTMCTSTGAQ